MESGLTHPMAADELLSVAEAARAVGRSRQAVYAHIAAGRLPATRRGGRLQISRHNLFAFFAELPLPRSQRRSTPVSDEDGEADLVLPATVAEACSYVGGVRPRFIYGLVADGKLRARQHGQSLQIEVSSLAALVEKSRLSPGQLRHLYPPPRLGPAKRRRC